MDTCNCNIPNNCPSDYKCQELIREKSDAPTVILTFLFIIITYLYSLLERI